jgi:hypothetical protein
MRAIPAEVAATEIKLPVPFPTNTAPGVKVAIPVPPFETGITDERE